MGAARIRARGAGALVILVLSCLLVGVPSAHAAFSATARSGFTASALVLAAPTASISPDCSPVGNSGKFRPRITVTQYGPVPRANGYVLTVTDPNGQRTIVDLSVSSTYSSDQIYGGQWTYAVQSQYRVPGTSNVWASRTDPKTLSC